LAYIGNIPAEKYSAFQKQDFTTSATTSYTLDNPVANANELALFINFVRQEPTASYSASGTTLTLTEATSSSDDMYCVYLGKAVQTVTPASGSVTNDMLASGVNTIAEADMWRLSADTNTGTSGDITANWERVDNSSFGYIGTGLTESSGIFSFPRTGIYHISGNFSLAVQAGDTGVNIGMLVTQDNSSYSDVCRPNNNAPSSSSDKATSINFQYFFDVTNITNDKFKFDTFSFSGSSSVKGNSNKNESHFSCIRIGDT
jgi:hypothetical protein